MNSNGAGKSNIHFRFSCRVCGRTLTGHERHFLGDKCTVCKRIYAHIYSGTALGLQGLVMMVLGK